MQRHGRTPAIAQSRTTEKTRDREQTEQETNAISSLPRKSSRSNPPKKERMHHSQDKKSHIKPPSKNNPEKENPDPSNSDMDFLHPPPRGGRLSAELQRF